MSGGSGLLSLVWMLLCVVGIILLAYLFTRYIAGRGSLGKLNLGGGAGKFKVLARLSLGRDQSAVLIQAGERYLLLGTANSGVSLLAELTSEEAQALCGPKPAPSSMPQTGFGDAMRSALRQRKKR